MYQIEEHRHRFAAWAAGRAASVNRCRFTVEQARTIIEAIELHESAKNIVNMPSPESFDEQHRQWRAKAIETAAGFSITMTHGVAAKLINIYLKSILVCAGYHDDPRGKAIHPPIDSLTSRVSLRTECGWSQGLVEYCAKYSMVKVEF